MTDTNVMGTYQLHNVEPHLAYDWLPTNKDTVREKKSRHASERAYQRDATFRACMHTSFPMPPPSTLDSKKLQMIVFLRARVLFPPRKRPHKIMGGPL